MTPTISFLSFRTAPPVVSVSEPFRLVM